MASGATVLIGALLLVAAEGALASGRHLKEESPTSPNDFVRTVRLGDSEAVESLLKKGANVDALDDFMYTPLAAAAESGLVNIVQILLASGANIDGKHPTYILPSPLHRAAAKGHLSVVQVLIANGADVNSFDSFFQQPIHEAAFFGKLPVLQELIAAGADVNAMDYNDASPLFAAAEHGQAEAAKILIASGANVKAIDRAGQTALHLAAGNGHVDVIRVLADAGAEIDATTRFMDTPLHRAASGGHPGAVQALLELGAFIDARNGGGYSALSLAATIKGRGFKESVKILKAGGADTSLLSDMLLGKLLEGDIASIKGLASAGADVNVQSTNDFSIGQTPLHKASGYGRMGLIQVLLDLNADRCVRDTNGKTPFDVFCTKQVDQDACLKDNKKPKQLKC